MTPSFHQTVTIVVRAASTGNTAGFGNFVVSSIELLTVIAITILAIVLPVVGLLLMLVVFCKVAGRILKTRSLRSPQIRGDEQ